MAKYLIILCFCFGSLLSSSAKSEEIKLAILHGDLDLFEYEITVAKMAARIAGYDFSLYGERDRNQVRLLNDLEQGTDQFNMFITGFSREREARFAQVDIPITRGLLGHRVFITRKDQLFKFRDIRSQRKMREMISVGSGVGWPDTIIFRDAGFNVYEATYENLWRMVSGARFVGFNRGLHEVSAEMKQRKWQYPDLVVEPTQMVAYKFDYFIYLNKKDQKIADDLFEALKKAYATGEFMENFLNHPRIKKVISVPSKSRNVYYVTNPLLSERVAKIPHKYWQLF